MTQDDDLMTQDLWSRPRSLMNFRLPGLTLGTALRAAGSGINFIKVFYIHNTRYTQEA